MNKDEALKMVIENLELQEFNTVNATLISYCKEALEQNDNLLTIAYMSGVAEGKSKALEQPAQEHNFCSRCGKRASKDLNQIHTCTPPNN